MSTVAVDTSRLRYPRRSVRQIMGQVMLALIPGTVLYAWLVDERVLFNIAAAVVASLFMEAAFIALRKRPVPATLSDGSIILAAWLLALCVPASLPLWQLIVGVFVMTGLGKHLFGGLGHNPFNPAMVAYAVLLVSFPVSMTDWQIPANADGRQSMGITADPTHSDSEAQDTSTSTLVSGTNDHTHSTDWDAVTGATALDRLREVRIDYRTASMRGVPPASSAAENHAVDSRLIERDEYRLLASELIVPSVWMWVNLAWLAGGIYLLFIRIITWHIPVSVLITVTAVYLTYALTSSATVMPLSAALLSGAVIFGAFFIATDPVSAATSSQGKLIYGAGIGLLTVVIREFSSYPEGFAFAVLLMNICVPLIDHVLTRSTLPASGPSGKSGT